MINKVVVGSGHGDAPKYVGEGVVSCGTPGVLGVPWPWYSTTFTLMRVVLIKDQMSQKV